MVKTFVVSIAVLAAWAVPGNAGGWSTPEWRMDASLVGTSDLFPGYDGTAADRGLRTTLEIGSDRRLATDVKLGVAVHAGWLGYRHFGQERHGWGGVTATLRRGGTRFEVEGELTPHRVKFPAQPEDAAFRRTAWRVGLRQTLGERTRLRLDATREDDDYVAAFDTRDGASLAGRAIVEVRVSPRVELSARAERSGRDTRAPDYRYAQTETGGGVTWSPSAWSFEAEVRSGVRHYREAPVSDANWQRRDQWIETLGTVRRRLANTLVLRIAAGFRDQTSSRIDRTFGTSTWAAGLEWSGGGN